MKTPYVISGCLVLLVVFAIPALADPGMIYGKIYTVDNEEFEGFIRWDRNEGSWDDIIDGNKDLDRHKKRHTSKYRDRRDRNKKVEVFGITVYSEDNNGWNWVSSSAQSGMRVGHLKSIIPDSDDGAVFVLKSGEEVYLEQGSTDIGDDIREIIVDDEDEGTLELYWDDIERIDFASSGRAECPFGDRLYGTVMTRRGDEFSGFICWDMDEIYSTDVLDGREKRRKREIEFGDIEKIERRSSSSATVTLKSGKVMRLDDSNDVNSSNRGVVISDFKLGRVVVEWDDFDYVVFSAAPRPQEYDDFDGGRKLEGTVYTEDGEKYTGKIRWDDDEEYTWELLDGNNHGVEFDIEFGMIASIEKTSYSSSRVTLKDGRSFKLRDSNDIDGDNKGIFIYDNDDDEVVVDWEDFEKVDFSH